MYNNRAKFALFSTFMVVTFIYFIWSKDKEIEDSGSIKVEHGKPDRRTNNEEMNAATTPNINIVIYSLPLSLLSPIVFPVYVIQVSQLYVTL